MYIRGENMYHVDKLQGYVKLVLPQVYDDALSHSELLYRVMEKLNEVIDTTNDYFGKDLKEYVGDILTDWYNDGTLSTIINDEVFTMKADTDYVNQQLDLIHTDVDATINHLIDTGVNIKRFGADFTGVTDSSIALQSAHDSLPSNGGIIIIPTGKYKINTPVTFTKPIKLIGAGSGDHTSGVSTANTGTDYDPTSQGSVLFTTSPTNDLLIVEASGFSATDLSIVNTSTEVPTNGVGLRIVRGDGVHLTRIRTARFYVNVSFEQSEYATITDCMFIDPVHYGLWLRNLYISDQGDMSIQGCAFSYSGAFNYRTATAIRWESGGGLKMNNNKINCGPRGGIGAFEFGVYLAVADAVSTSVFTFTGNSFENLIQTAIMVRPQGLTGEIAKITIVGNEFAYIGNAGINLEGSDSKPLRNISIGNNVMDSMEYAIYLKNAKSGTISPNTILNISDDFTIAVCLDVGCRGIHVNRQNIPLKSTKTLLFKNEPSSTFNNYTDYPNDIDFHDKRGIPKITSKTVYTDLWTMKLNVYESAIVDVVFNVLVEGVGQGSFKATRYIHRGWSGTTTIAVIGSDMAVGNAFDIFFDSSLNDGTVKIQVKLNTASTGTGISGSATLDVRGELTSLQRN
jgi:hypothetical protein